MTVVAQEVLLGRGSRLIKENQYHTENLMIKNNKDGTIVNVPHGELALRYCNLKIELQVLRSGAGYYLGTFSPEEGPISRESEEYWPTEAIAELAMENGDWTQRDHP